MSTTIISELKNYFSQYPSITFKKRENILLGQEISQSVYLILKGAVKTILISNDGKELISTLLGPGNIFPMRGTHYVALPKYTFQAVNDIEIKKAPKEDYLLWVRGQKEVSSFLLEQLIERLNRSVTRMQNLLIGNARQKVASTFLFISGNLGTKQNDGTLVDLSLTHQEIAEMAGLARETVTVEIDKLKKEGLVEMRKNSIFIKESLKDIVSIF